MFSLVVLTICCITLLSSALAFSYSTSTTSNSNHRIPTRQHNDDVLYKMIRFFGIDMVDTTTNRFYYYCYPIDGKCEHVHMPIRDLAAAWDASKALQYLVDINVDEDEVMLIRQQLKDAIKHTLSIYQSNLQNIESGDGVHLSEDMLLETSTIGHSALLLLGICNACSLSILNQNEAVIQEIDGLVQGILSQQLDNGAFDIEFNSSKDTNYLRGIEFFPGEAMLALLSAHDILLSIPTSATTCQSIIQSMDKAFAFYSNYYYTEEDVDINYNIWQVLCFSKYHDTLSIDSNNQQVKINIEEVKKYVLEMCQEICQSRSWKYQLLRGQSFYQNIETVEIACGLDALAEGIRINRQEDTKDTEDLDKLFTMHAKNALYFIQWTQDQVSNECIVGYGGLGYGGIQVFEQRLDVTGHAISALVKLHKLAVTIP